MAQGRLSIRDDNPFKAANPHYLRIDSEGSAPFGVANEGFRGIGVRKGEAYNFSAQVRRIDGSPALRVELYGSDGTLLDSARIEGSSPDWKECKAVLHPNDTDAKAKLYISTWCLSFRKRPGKTALAASVPTWSRLSPT